MTDKRSLRCCAAFVATALAAATAHGEVIRHGSTSIDMEFVTVGDPGNAGDVQTYDTYGAVPYVYRIGKYEVTDRQWDAVSGASSTDLLNDPGYWSGDQPVARISWNEAAMFCNWLTSGHVTMGAYRVNSSGAVTGIDRRAAAVTYAKLYVLPTQDEWYKAAYYDPDKPGGAGYYDYPAGSDDVPDGIDFAGDTAFEAVFDEGYSAGHPNSVYDSGAPSPYGTLGQGGNAWEFTETTISGYYYIRGGSYDYNAYYLAADKFYFTTSTNECDCTTGFRVACIPEPGNLIGLLSAMVGLALRARRRNT